MPDTSQIITASVAGTRYRWPGMTRREVRGTVRRRLRALAAAKSRMCPAAFGVRALAAAAVDRADYARTRNPFFRDAHAIMISVASKKGAA